MSDDGRNWLSHAGLIVTPAIVGFVGYLSARLTNSAMENVVINGQQGGSVDPVGFGVVVGLVGVAIAAIPYLPGRVGR